MKDFLKNVGATIVGLMLFSVIATVIGIMGIVGMIASTEATQTPSSNSVLVLKLDGMMQEQSSENEIISLFSDSQDGTQGLQETLSAIKGKGKQGYQGHLHGRRSPRCRHGADAGSA